MDLSGVEVVINPDYRLGQTASLQAGLKALENADLGSVAICLVDHPLISAETIRKLIEIFHASRPPVVVPTFQGQRGHPVLIDRELFPELLSLGPEEGANSVIRKYREQTRFVEVDDPSVLIDIDDPEAYRAMEP